MKISINWLKDFVEISKAPEKLGLALTTHSFEIDAVEKMDENLENIVVGVIEKIKKHPNADRLKICEVDVGGQNASDKKLEIVCGGTNLSEKMKVAVAKTGAYVQWHGEGDLVKLEKTKVRGVESSGMICSANEIGLGTGHEEEREILDISFCEARAGVSLARALKLDDVVLDVDNKSLTHRPDCWGHYGVAREVSAVFGKKLKPYAPKKLVASVGKNLGTQKLSVKIESPKLCRRYMGLIMDGIEVGASPEWMQARLRAAGSRPINNIVDITNYVMLELGQPMHAFDLGLLDTSEIIVRSAKDGENFVGLDGEKYVLEKNMCVIADKKKIIALGGVKGGENSGIKDKTRAVVLEAANFDPITVRKTSQKLDLRTDSSARFEKSLDPNMVELAMARCVELIQEICPKAKIVSNVADAGVGWQKVLFSKTITLDLQFLENKIGAKIPEAKVVGILKSLGFGVKKKTVGKTLGKTNVLEIKIPSWRATKDISIPEDLVEEVARIYGFDNIPHELPRTSIILPEINKEHEFQYKVSSILSQDFRFVESMSYSFVSVETLHKLDLNEKTHVQISNPMSLEQSHLRRSLLPNMFLQISKNMHLQDKVKMFDVGKVYLKDKKGEIVRSGSKEFLPSQPLHVAGVLSGKTQDKPFVCAHKSALGLLEKLGVKFDLKKFDLEKWMHPGRSVGIFVGKKQVGVISELHPAYMKSFDLDSRVGFFEINLSEVFEKTETKIYKSLPKFPSVKRDIAFVVDEKISYEKIVELLRGWDLIKGVELFDVYRGDGVGKNKKSMAFHLSFSDENKTLIAQEVEKVFQEIVGKLKKEFEVEMRK